MISPLLTKEGGFSFLAMLLLLLLTVLGGVALVTSLRPSFSATSFKVTAARVAALRTALAAYADNHGATPLPPALNALVIDDGVTCDLDNTPASATYLTLQGWCGPYIDQVFGNFLNEYQTDGWGKAFTYAAATGVITSCGPDQTCGTSDDIPFNP